MPTVCTVILQIPGQGKLVLVDGQIERGVHQLMGPVFKRQVNEQGFAWIYFGLRKYFRDPLQGFDETGKRDSERFHGFRDR